MRRGDRDFAPVGSGYLDGTAEVEQYTVETIQGGVRFFIHLWDTPGLTGRLAQSRLHDALSVVHDAFAVLREREVRRVDGIFVFAKASGRLQAPARGIANIACCVVMLWLGVADAKNPQASVTSYSTVQLPAVVT